jgi:uncharacterized DUF497 family protein
MEFEWDERKALANLAKHGIAFEDAIEVFDDPRHVAMPARTVGSEVRRQVVGRILRTTYLIVFTVRSDVTGNPIFRIISARPASRIERQIYERPGT